MASKTGEGWTNMATERKRKIEREGDRERNKEERRGGEG